jgi:hypothetical protein
LTIKSNNLIALDEKKLSLILNNPAGLGLPHPLSKQIFLLTVTLAGTTHIPEITNLGPKINIGDHLSFFREPDNPHDDKAILVKNPEKQKLGYIPRTNNEILARLMDAGKLLYGVVKEKKLKGKWLQISMEIYLDD